MTINFTPTIINYTNLFNPAVDVGTTFNVNDKITYDQDILDGLGHVIRTTMRFSAQIYAISNASNLNVTLWCGASNDSGGNGYTEFMFKKSILTSNTITWFKVLGTYSGTSSANMSAYLQLVNSDKSNSYTLISGGGSDVDAYFDTGDFALQRIDANTIRYHKWTTAGVYSTADIDITSWTKSNYYLRLYISHTGSSGSSKVNFLFYNGYDLKKTFFDDWLTFYTKART